MRRLTALLLLLGLIGLSSCKAALPAEREPVDRPAASEEAAQTADPFAEARARMVEQGIVGYGIESEAVIEAMLRVPRHAFVPEAYLSQAYDNHPLPIGYGQTISQPYIVALMSQELGVGSGDKVLEIGTGSGYQAAILAEMGAQVYTMEIIEPLARQAEGRLKALGYEVIRVRNADGYFGWPEEAPFDGIIVTAAPDHVPQPLLEQLKVGATMVIPVGPVGGIQELWKITRLSEDEFQSVSLGGVRFVPLTRANE